MGDQIILHPAHNHQLARSHNNLPDDVPVASGQARKRFHRGAAQRAPDQEVVTHLAAPSPDGSVGSALAPYRAPDPVGDRWNELRLVSPGVRRHILAGAPLVNFFRRDPAAKAFDLLRTRLLQTLRAHGWSRIAIASPTHGCGATFTAVNLAQSLARIADSRTVLMDVNQRTPGVADMLDMPGIGDMRGYLGGAVRLERHLMRASQTLALGLAAGPTQDAAEILHGARCAETLADMVTALRPDVVLYDLPPVLAYDDLAAFLPQVDGVLLVADGTQTTASQIAACERVLKGQTQVLGVILNRARASGLNNSET